MIADPLKVLQSLTLVLHPWYLRLHIILQRVHENISIIGDLSKTHWIPIGDPSETNMPDRRPIEDRHA